MKFKSLISALLVLAISVSTAKADEGMWLLTLLGKNYKQMKAQGFKLKPSDIYNVNNSSLKDAIVVFGGYCTGEIVSDQGLVFTNHHCGYESIQQHSGIGHDYLKDGFWAQTLEDEIPTPGLYVSILQEFVDVTSEVLAGVSNHNEDMIKKNIEKVTEKYKKKYSSDFHRIEVKPFFEGNSYYLSAYIDYKDVRMVGTPPDAIGKFGGDTDNWMWPRHTCDFSVFRIYVDKNGNPAEYSASNVPFKPKRHLDISLKGYKKGDFAMVMGFPGTTLRYSTSYEIENDMRANEYRAKIRGIRQDILHADMEASDEVRIKYATKFAHSSNYWKKSIEANKSLTSLNTIGDKQKLEKKFVEWYTADNARKSEYSTALANIETVCKDSRENSKVFLYVYECFFNGMEMMEFAYDILSYISNPSETPKEEFIEKCHNFYKNYNYSTDYKSTIAMAKLYMEDIPENYHPSYFKSTTLDSAVNGIFSSMFVTQQGFDKFMENPSMELLSDDNLVVAFLSVMEVYREMYSKYRAGKEALGNARRIYTKGTNEMNIGDNPYPDANFTERLTYGTVQDYKPKDGVKMEYFTTTDGVLEKEIPGDYEFDVPAKLKSLIQNKDFGRYVDADGTLHTCFLTDNDITGGNSGSPVIDGSGNLIGLAFDGNSESMCSDWIFNPGLQRCINVDIRYVLFIIEKYGNCQRIISELTFAK